MATDSKFKEESKLNNEINNKEKYECYKNKNKNENENIDIEELPLPNINNLRKWISKEKKAS